MTRGDSGSSCTKFCLNHSELTGNVLCVALFQSFVYLPKPTSRYPWTDCFQWKTGWRSQTPMVNTRTTQGRQNFILMEY